MPLTTEERVELMKRAREAKANKKRAETPVVNVEPPVEQPPPPKVKKSRKKNEIAPLPEPAQVIQVSDEEEAEVTEVVEVPIPVPKKKALPTKWLKKQAEPEKVCCDAKLTKEKYVIDDEPQIVEEKIVIPSKATLKKPRAPRSSTPLRTLTITEPAPITELIQDLEKADMKYRPVQVRQVPPPSAPIQIKRVESPFKLFDY